MPVKAEPQIQHADIARFADEHVNLRREDAREYRAQVGRLRDQLASYIADHPDYALVKMLHSGSVAKGTALRTLNDMDVAVYVRKDAAPDETRLIAWLAERLREAYPRLSPEQFVAQAHCVRVSFRGSGLNVDVVPVLYEGAADDRGFLVAKDTGQRVLTSVRLHLDFIRRRKDLQPAHFAQVVRLVKWWIRTRKGSDQDFRFKSFLAELLVAHLADSGLALSSYPATLEKFFTYVVTSGLSAPVTFDDYYPAKSLPAAGDAAIWIIDPVNPDNNVASGYSASDRTRIVEAAHDALDAINEAHYSTTKGRATDLWRQVLGPSFR